MWAHLEITELNGIISILSNSHNLECNSTKFVWIINKTSPDSRSQIEVEFTYNDDWNLEDATFAGLGKFWMESTDNLGMYIYI